MDDGGSLLPSAPLGLRLSPPRPAARARTLLRAWRVTLPAAATAWSGFHAGGFFPGPVALIGLTLCAALVLRVTAARAPFAGWSVGLGVASGALAGFAVWILISAAWSHASARAVTEFDRSLLYLLVLTLTGS